MSDEIAFVVPGRLDQLTGGYLFERHIVDGLRTRGRLVLALSLLRDPLFDLLLSGETDFAALPELMPRLALSSEGALCHTVRYP